MVIKAKSAAARMQKMREKRIDSGGKSIGVTVDADTAFALDLLHCRYDFSQREAIQAALQYLCGVNPTYSNLMHGVQVFKGGGNG